MSEHRASLEKGNADADLLELQRKLESLRKQNIESTTPKAGWRWVADRPVVAQKRLTPAEQRGLSSSTTIKEPTDRGLANAY